MVPIFIDQGNLYLILVAFEGFVQRFGSMHSSIASTKYHNSFFLHNSFLEPETSKG